MTTTPAATALSDINAPQFSIITKALTSEGSSADGRRRFHATASSTIIDRAGHQISLPAIQKMADKFREGITIFMDHKNEVRNAYGTTDDAQIVQRGPDKNGTPVWDLDIFGVVNDPNPVAKQLHDSIEGGYVKLGCSIDAFVTAKPIQQKSGSLLIDGLDVYAASIVGVPMNQRSWTQKAVRAIKSFYGEADEEDDSMPTSNPFAASEAVLAPLEAVETTVEGAITDPVVEKVVTTANAPALDRQPVMETASEADCPTCGHAKSKGGDCTNAFHDTKKDGGAPQKGGALAVQIDFGGKSIDAVADEAIHKGTTEGGQEADPAATPETAPDDTENVPDPALLQKALAFEASDVVALLGHVQTLVKSLEVRDDKIVELSEALTTAKTDLATRDAEMEVAAKVIEKMMAMPLRPKTVGYVSELDKALPTFLAPEVRKFLSRTAGDDK